MTDKERQDKIELLKIKQGLVEESEVLAPREKPPELTGWAKFKNELYYSKWIILIVAFFALAAGFIIYKTVTTPKADLSVLVIAKDDYSLIDERIEAALERYTPDFDGNGYTHVDVICVPTNSSDPKMFSAYRTKLFGEMTTGNSMLVLLDNSAIDILKGDDDYTALEDERNAFAENIAITENGFHIRGSQFAFDAKLDTDQIQSDLILAVRKADSASMATDKTATENHDKAYTVFTNIVNGVYANAGE